MGNYTPNDNIDADIDEIEDGEDAIAGVANRPIEGVADRTEGLKNGLEHIATAQSLTTDRNTSDGITRIRQFTTIAALKAFAVGASNDREWAALVGSDGSNLVYVYDHGNTDPDGLPFQAKPDNNAGLWKLLNYSLYESQPGVPTVGSDKKLNNGFHDTNHIVKIEDWTDTLTTDVPVSLAFSTTDTFVTGATYNLAGLAVGDKIHLVLTFFARAEQTLAPIDSSAVAAIDIDGDGIVLTAPIMLKEEDDVESPYRQYTMNLFFVATATSHDFNLQIRGRATDNVTGRLAKPLSGVFTVIRP